MIRLHKAYGIFSRLIEGKPVCIETVGILRVTEQSVTFLMLVCTPL